MRVLVIGINYTPEVAGIAPQTAALCRHLAARSDDVLMLTARPHYPAWRVSNGFRRQRFIREKREGVRVLHLPSYIPDASRRTRPPPALRRDPSPWSPP